MKKVLVTGADGQLGKTIEELYSKNNLNISFEFASKSELDITNAGEINMFFDRDDFDYCINCAAYTNVEQAEKTPEIAYKVNAKGIKNLALACKEFKIMLIHISTDYVFDGEKGSPYAIDDQPNPINEYGKSKLEGEKHIKDILKAYFIIRTSWLYSKTYGCNFYITILSKAKTEKELYVTDSQIGCPTDTTNLSDYIMSLIINCNSNYGIKHYCGNQEMTWYDFAKQILIENKLFDKIKLEKANNYANFAQRPKYSVLSNSKTP